MVYTQELIDEVKELYPNATQMIACAENGSYFLGRYLDDNCSTSISLDRILLAKSLEDLKKEALIERRKVELYHKWRMQDPRK